MLNFPKNKIVKNNYHHNAKHSDGLGAYDLLEKLNSGGMAEVFLGRKMGAGGIGKFVAIKRILPQFCENPEFIDMFKAEAEISISLQHRNIVSVYEVGEVEKQLFLVMDYIEGRNLRQVLHKVKKSEQELPIEHAVFMIREAAAGLEYAHQSLNPKTGKSLNIVHRDISPQNIMVSFEGEIKLVDFGISKASTQIDVTQTGVLKGKLGYMSPEQADAKTPIDARSDIFSLGIVLWELVTHQRLFLADSIAATLSLIKESKILDPQLLNRNLPEELSRIILKSLSRDREERYQTAEQLHNDLSRFLNRQYPEFLPRDFSQLMRSLFQKEIEDSRQRVIEYAKITPRQNLSIGEGAPSTPVREVTGTDSRGGRRSASTGTSSRGSIGTNSSASSVHNTNSASIDLLSIQLESQGASVTGNSRVKRAMVYGAAFVGVVFLLLALLLPIWQNKKSAGGNGELNSTQLSSEREGSSSASSSTETDAGTSEFYEVAVYTQPAGAELLINGWSIGKTTPTKLQLKRGEKIRLTIRHAGYYDRKVIVLGPAVIDLRLHPKSLE